jgi:lipopolysaccharide transport system ATP-binding protein
MGAVEFRNVSKIFHRHTGKLLLRYRLKQLFTSEVGDPFYALKNVSFRMEHGESLAIVGANGAGKSTLLGLAAGLALPDEGNVAVNGRVAALLELGSGFHPDLTGEENVRLNASLIGLSRKRTAGIFEEIVDFSGIGDFIREPLRTYSTGMIMRLGFSVAVMMDPEILLVDEVLAVGDAAFQTKCFDKVREFRHRGKMLLCVSHSAGMIQELCDQAIWLDHGEVVMSGGVTEVMEAYAGRQAAATV